MEPKIVREQDLAFGPHRVYPRVFAKVLLGQTDQPAFSTHRVRIEPGAEISPHVHEASAETFYILAGTGVFLWSGDTVPFATGSIGLAPAGFTHGLRNTGTKRVELLAVFSPPIA